MNEPIQSGEMSWTPKCSLCNSEDGSAITGLCRNCYKKTYYVRNREAIRERQNAAANSAEGLAKSRERRKLYLANNEEAREKQRVNLRNHSRRPGARFGKAKRRAAEKNVEWHLTKQTYFALIQMECFYCDGFFQRQAEQTGIGLDRIDPSKGYIPGNVISCCGACNLTRQTRWTVPQTRVMIQSVITYNKLNNITETPQSTIESDEE